jgi:hypothetical protein
VEVKVLGCCKNPSSPLLTTACLVSSYILFAAALLFDEKIRQYAAHAAFKTV